MRWTWDPNKATDNLRKHRVSFELAVWVFEDPWHLTLDDPSPHEQRYRTLGLVGDVVLFVVHTGPSYDDVDGDGRIISARKATASERRRYHEDR